MSTGKLRNERMIVQLVGIQYIYVEMIKQERADLVKFYNIYLPIVRMNCRFYKKPISFYRQLYVEIPTDNRKNILYIISFGYL